ncbi:MAG: response regulator transcription factor [Loktanella sp.]|nr:response regulator transcription factor [Loktanella sp.]
MTKILVADDHNLLAEAICTMVDARDGFEALTTDSLPGVTAVLADHDDIDMVLLDLKMPGMNGLPSVKEVINKAGSAKVVLFTGYVDAHFVQAAVKEGCRGLIPKTMPLKSLNSVIDLILSGQVFMPMQNAGAEAAGGAANHNLNDKELFVLRLAADGLTNKEVARNMDVSEVTVKMHMRAICKKLNARNRAHAAVISREKSII